jgi:malonate transporter MadL subunit
MIYIPIVVAMAAKQNVIGAIDGGLMAIIAGIAAVFISFLFIPIISNFNKDK